MRLKNKRITRPNPREQEEEKRLISLEGKYEQGRQLAPIHESLARPNCAFNSSSSSSNKSPNNSCLQRNTEDLCCEDFMVQRTLRDSDLSSQSCEATTQEATAIHQVPTVGVTKEHRQGYSNGLTIGLLGVVSRKGDKYGFISNHHIQAHFNCNAFAPATTLRDLNQGDQVVFDLVINQRGQPQAHNLRPYPVFWHQTTPRAHLKPCVVSREHQRERNFHSPTGSIAPDLSFLFSNAGFQPLFSNAGLYHLPFGLGSINSSNSTPVFPQPHWQALSQRTNHSLSYAKQVPSEENRGKKNTPDEKDIERMNRAIASFAGQEIKETSRLEESGYQSKTERESCYLHKLSEIEAQKLTELRALTPSLVASVLEEWPSWKPDLCDIDPHERSEASDIFLLRFLRATDFDIGCAAKRLRDTLYLRAKEQSGKLAGTNLSEDKICAVCLEDIRSHLFVPCGHMCLCNKCAREEGYNKYCPICRSPAEQLIRVYL